ncbi:Hypothetical protein CINCED_3A003933 [Cinara cedri]|uniref:Uncharacterized protein n=1 Tax=Cinara cedri TaxID=506608 RepID=A0A5E4M186_9HEMI|nr:Hypothetical protein CINCED_3A003933 [Cinara cedri]
MKIPDIVKKVPNENKNETIKVQKEPITTENHKKINSKQTTRLNNIKLSPDVSSNDISEDSETSTPEDTFDHNVRHKKDNKHNKEQINKKTVPKSNLDIKDEPITDKNANKKSETPMKNAGILITDKNANKKSDTDKNANKKSETPMKNAGILSINMLSEPFIPTVKSEIKEKPSKKDIVKEIPENPNKVSNDSKNETPKLPKKPIAAEYQKNIVNGVMQSAPINPTNKSETKEKPFRKDKAIEIPEMAKISSIDRKKESPNVPKKPIAAEYQKNILNKVMQSAPINPTNKSETKDNPSIKDKGTEIPEMAKISSIDSKKESPKGPKEPNAAENQKLVVSNQTTKPNKQKLFPNVTKGDISENSEISTPEDTIDPVVVHKKDNKNNNTKNTNIIDPMGNPEVKISQIADKRPTDKIGTPEKTMGIVNKNMRLETLNPTIKSDIIERSSTKDIDMKIPDIVKKVPNENKNETIKVQKEPITTENHKKINSKQTTRL